MSHYVPESAPNERTAVLFQAKPRMSHQRELNSVTDGVAPARTRSHWKWRPGLDAVGARPLETQREAGKATVHFLEFGRVEKHRSKATGPKRRGDSRITGRHEHRVVHPNAVRRIRLVPRDWN